MFLTFLFLSSFSYSQEKEITKILEKQLDIYLYEYDISQKHSISCVIDSVENGYHIAIHGLLSSIMLEVSGCKRYYLYNDSIYIFVRTNSKHLIKYYPKVSRIILDKEIRKQDPDVLITGELPSLVFFVDGNYEVTYSKWYQDHEPLPDNLWEFNKELIDIYNDSIEKIHQGSN